MDYLEIARNVIQNEIDGLQFLSKNLNDSFNEVVKKIISSNGRLVVTGMGKSGLIGKKIVATLASTGTPSLFIHPAEAYHGDLGMILNNDMIICISNSGETEEIVKLLSFFKHNKNQVIALCANKESTLGKFSDFFLDISVPKEACPLLLAPTTSTTATLALGDALAIALMEAREFKPENFARFHPGGSLGRKLLWKVSDKMRVDSLPIIFEDQKFENLVSEMSKGRLGTVVVLEKESKNVLGIVTDGDLRRAMQTHKGDIVNLLPTQIMTKNPTTILESEKLIKAEEKLQEKKISILLVLEDKKLKGLLSIYDL
ncbi:KpsF/GutQ family sugar-phosphate isomerase [Bacteriovoracaceae bacterium]|nr:KpsF/GutQ family sugar-phosphate isomerase [Bacteriovoracaceae bacterium]